MVSPSMTFVTSALTGAVEGFEGAGVGAGAGGVGAGSGAGAGASAGAVAGTVTGSEGAQLMIPKTRTSTVVTTRNSFFTVTYLAGMIIN